MGLVSRSKLLDKLFKASLSNTYQVKLIIMKTIIHGFFIGLAELIPGISGSTIALSFGIYEKLIGLMDKGVEIVKDFLVNRDIKATFDEIKNLPWKFIIPLLGGMFGCIILASRLIVWVEHEYPQYLFAALLGLVFATLIIPYRSMKSFSDWAFAIFTAIACFVLFGFSSGSSSDPSMLMLFGSGTLAISGLILPGVSGSFILLALGVYFYIVESISEITSGNFDGEILTNLTIFSIGVGVGAIIIVKIIKFLLANYKNKFMAFIFGVLIASARVLWPFVKYQDKEFEIVSISSFTNTEVAFTAISFIIFLMIGILINMRSQDANH